MVNIAIGGQLSRKFKLPNIELYYGPYSSALAAHNTLSLASIGLNIIGYTVGIAVNPVFDPDNPNKMLSYDYILEYWYKGGTSLQNLVPKQEAQVLSNWNQENSQSLDYIKNKPTNVSAFANDAGYLTQHQSLDNYYTKTQVDSSLSGKANTSDVNDSLNLKADKSDTYTKTQIDTALSAKANSADVYTKSAVDSALAGKQNVLTFDNTPTAESTNPVTSGGVEASLATKQDTIQDLTTIRSGAALGATAKQPATTIAGYGITDAYTKQEVNNLVSTPHQNYVTVADYASLPATGSADTIYRVSNYDGTQVDATKYAEYAWDGTQYIHLSTKMQIGEVFDISAYNATGGTPAKYTGLADALGTNGANVPSSVRRGGMRVNFIKETPATYSVEKTEGLEEQPTGYVLMDDPEIGSGTYNAGQLSAFGNLPTSVGAENAVTYYRSVLADDVTTYTKWVITLVQSSAYKYVQYRYMGADVATAATFTNVANWQGVDDIPTAGSNNLVESNGIENVTSLHDVIDLSTFTKTHNIISSTGTWQVANNNDVIFVPITPGKKYIVKAGNERGCYIAVLNSNEDKTDGSVTTFATGWSERLIVGVGTTYSFVSPIDGNYLYIVLKLSAGKTNPTVMQSTLVVDTIPVIESDIQGIDTRLASVETNVVPKVTSMYSDLNISRSIAVPAGETQWMIQGNPGVWYKTAGENYRSKTIRIEGGKDYTLTINNTTRIAFLKSYESTPVAGNSPDFCTGYTTTESIESSINFTAPVDANVLFIYSIYGGLTVTISLTAYDKFVDECALKTDLETAINVPISMSTKSRVIINSEGKWSRDGGTIKYIGGVTIPIIAGKTYRLTTTTGTFYAPLKTVNNRDTGNTPDYATGYDNRVWVVANTYDEFTCDDANYLYLCTGISTGYLAMTLYETSSIKNVAESLTKEVNKLKEVADDAGYNVRKRLAEIEGNSLTPITIPVDTNGFEVPQTREVLNVQKKAKQMTDIVWTPLAAVPNRSGTFPANTPVTGLPYSSVKEKDKAIGDQVSIYTFMTAVNNPFSLLYTENVSGNNSASAWGATYHGDNCNCYYGVVCSAFTSYVTGMPVQWETAYDAWCSKWRLNIIKIYDQSAQGLRIGDIYWRSGHNRLIVGLKRDSNGDVTHVVVSESTGNYVRENSPQAASSFNNLIASEGGIIYRNVELYKNNRYTPSPFVAVGDEVITPYAYNDDICTFAGDKACFRENDLIVLNYNLKNTNSAWTGIEVYKDGTLVDTYTLANIDQSALPEGQRGHALNLGSSHTYGTYKARLTDGANYSDYTYWEVLQTIVSYSLADGVSHITWTSANGKAVAFVVASVSGGKRLMNELSNEEIAARTIDVDLTALRMLQVGSGFPSGDNYLKVYFEGEYGRVTNEPLNINV